MEEVKEDNVLTRDEILGIADFQIEKVIVPEWKGKSVYVRGLTGEERDTFEELIFGSDKDQKEKLKNFRAKLISLCVCNANGERLFTQDDIPVLGKKSASAIERLYRVAERLSGFRRKDVDELTKNS
jgi:hypothetical protein